MTVFSRLARPFADEDLYLLKVLKLVTSDGRDLLYRIFQYGCPDKDASRTLEEYLLQDKLMSLTQYKKIFNNAMRDSIASNPACDEFDISLLLTAIKVSCDRLASMTSLVWSTRDETKLEYLLKCLKDERNVLAHDLPRMNKTQMLQKVEDLRNLFVKIVERACERYGIDDTIKDQQVNELNIRIDQIRDQPLTEAEILQYKNVLRLEHGMRTLGDMGARELKDKFIRFLLVNPVSFVDGYDTQISLDLVFSRIELVEADRFATGMRVDHTSILLLVESQANSVAGQQQSQIATLVLIVGAAGSGKSTLGKMLMHEWSKPSTNISYLNEYDLVLPFECRNHHVESFIQLLKFLLPNTCSVVGDDVSTCALNLRLLIVVDGLDESNTNSKKALRQILELCKGSNHTVVCLSRPERTPQFYREVPQEYKKIHLQITGIPPEERGNFSMRYHDQLVQQGRSEQSTEGLVQYVNKTVQLQEFYRFPINLVLLTYLWAYLPDQVNQVTTVTQLYLMINKMLEQKLLQRLKCLDSEKLKKIVKAFIEVLSREALICLSLDQVILQSPSRQRLKELFCDNKVDFEEVASAFLVFKVQRTGTESEEQLWFPHKDAHDFYAANGLLLAITDHNFNNSLREVNTMAPPRPTVTSLTKSIKNLFRDNVISSVLKAQHDYQTLDITKYQNLLKHFAGLLSLRGDGGVERGVARELVKLLRKSGISSHDQWLDIISETRCDQQTVQFIAASFFTKVRKFHITSSRVAAYDSLMPHVNPSSVTLDLDGDPDHLTHLKSLLGSISVKRCGVDLLVWQHYLHPEEDKTTDTLLQCLLHQDARCRVESLRGHLSGDPTLADLRFLKLHVVLSSDQQAAALTSGLLQQPHSLREVRVVASVSPGSLTPLPPDAGQNLLDLSQVVAGQETWGCQVARALVPSTRFHTVRLPDDLTADAGLQLEQDLNTSGVPIDKYAPFSYLERADVMRNKRCITISDSLVEVYKENLKFANPESVTLDLEGDPDLLPHLQQLLGSLSLKECRVDLRAWQQFRDPEEGKTIDHFLHRLLHQQARCSVVGVRGQMSSVGVQVLPSTLAELHLSLASDQQAHQLLPQLSSKCPHLPNLSVLGMHVAAGVTPAALTPLPDVSTVKLYLSDVDDPAITRACQVAESLQPPRSYYSLTFPRATLSLDGCDRLLARLAQAVVRVSTWVFMPDTCITEDHRRHLYTLARSRLRCSFGRWSEERMWEW